MRMAVCIRARDVLDSAAPRLIALLAVLHFRHNRWQGGSSTFQHIVWQRRKQRHQTLLRMHAPALCAVVCTLALALPVACFVLACGADVSATEAGVVACCALLGASRRLCSSAASGAKLSRKE